MAILYITQQGQAQALHKSGNRIIVKKARDVLQEIPIVQLDEVVIFGNGHITTPTIGYLLHKNIPVSFLSLHGKYKGKLQPPDAKDTLIRKHQYAVAADPQRCLELAKGFIRGKLTNTIRFSQRQRTQNAEIKSAIDAMRQTLGTLEDAKNLESLLGYEGHRCRCLLSGVPTIPHTRLGFHHATIPDRHRTLLTQCFRLVIRSCITTSMPSRNVVGLDPYCGYFHQPRHGHAASRIGSDGGVPTNNR